MIVKPFSAAVLLASLACTTTVAFAGEASRPNIVVIICDDMGYSDVGFGGAPDIRTPNLDSLAKASTICTSGYVAHPFCGPSRMGLMTGRYPHTFGGQYNLPPLHAGMDDYNKLGIPKSETMISTVLHDAGYTTGAIGKWHLGEEADYHPNNRGFDDFYGFLGGGHNYFPQQYSGAYERQKRTGKARINDYLLPLEHNGNPTTEDEYLTDALSKQAVRFINEASEKESPFFLYLAYNAPHAPMEATEEDLAANVHIKNRKRRVVAGMMTAVDRGVGLVTDALKKQGRFDDTLVVFLSDNGGKSVFGSSNAPFRGVKGDTWEGGFRVPMFFHWPKKIPAQKFDHPISSLDFYPTFAAVADAKIPSDKQLDGKNVLSSFVEGNNPRPNEVIFAMRHRGGYTDVSARRGDWKAVRYANQPWRLFKITEDLSEEHDLASSNPERLEELIAAAEKWSHTHETPLFFDSPGARDKWVGTNMPHFEKTFAMEVGAPKLRPVSHVTDNDIAEPVVKAPRTTASGVKLKRGDSTMEHFVAMEKAKWEKNGWTWNQQKAEAIFREIDTNNDGIASGKEKKTYWSK
ncbi:sulfatase-like hydrolase/transferase [Rhodopirellula sallentina]|uniref:N-acetylgalactosamine-4-sulfatase n=1 Tax=Rhodopirellula sallentina SM41 TaxID=1263870 RepID=M5TV32_9BACT|nr:sulfatase-like hydrolase/transferase [Rhodopirellula sallentina]EMI53030.1 n-acetylgalactosamine-4-sulfatase [Rhodopirellula sallentina SM41]